MPQIWAGVDIGKTHHHAVVIDVDGKRLLSRRVKNDEGELLALISDVLEISQDGLLRPDAQASAAGARTPATQRPVGQ
ncbi:IS110 family transposase [Actinopolymorpha pittospori]|uniref:NBD/HSP70 family sugar kinase n=1 Tax=Actinopolymorpha pittospori TaxID=648752 RepID=A0A927R634_9ACTN|nr:putative NBD/HSP70 family sugar kinase [Actinopolymorpha pittospori]